MLGTLMEIDIRDAGPEDADFLAWAILAAARGPLETCVWDLAFPGPDVDKLALLGKLVVATPECAAHYSGFVIAELDNTPVAAACGFIPSEKTPEHFTEALLNVVDGAGWEQARQLELLQSFEVFARCLPMSHDENWVLEYIATKPEARGKGVTQKLLEEVLECGRDEEIEIAKVAYFVGNEAAKKVYRRLGFKETHEFMDKDFEREFGTPGVVHMSLPL
jgi:GNAT superfamily N-acetyltransferase